MKKTILIGILMALALVFGVSAQVGQLNIQDSIISMNADPGTTAQQTFTVQNQDTTLTMSPIALSGSDLTGPETIPQSQVTFSPSSLSLAPSGSTTVTALVSLSSNQRAGTYTGLVTATYNDTNYDTATLQLTVNERTSMSASAPSTDIAKGNSGIVTITITNTGNHDLNNVAYTIDSALTRNGGTETLTYSGTSTGTLSISYGSSTTKVLAFNVPANQASGTYTGTATFTYGNVTETSTITVTVAEPQYSVNLPEVVHPEANIGNEVTTQITITNDGDYALTGINLTTDDSDTTITYNAPATFNPGNSFTATVTTKVPDDAKGNDQTTVGKLTFTSNEYTTSSDIKVTVGNKLEIDRVRMSIADASWKTIHEDEKYDPDQLKPGAKFEMTIKVENLFDDNSEIDIDDISVDAVIANAGEDGDDLEGDVDSFKVKAQDKSDDVKINFDDDNFAWDIDEGEHQVTIKVTGVDDNGGEHEDTFNFTLDFKRDSGAYFMLQRADAVPSSAQCGSSVNLYIDGRSIGEDNDDKAQLKITSTALGIQIKEEFAIGAYDDDDCDAMDPDEDPEDCNQFSYKKTFIVPQGIASGTYPIKVELFNDGGDEKTDEGTIDVQVSCSSTSTSSTTTSSSGTSSSSSNGGTSSSGTTTKTTTTTQPTQTTQPVVQNGQPGQVAVYYGGSQTPTSTQGVAANEATKITDTTYKKGSFKDSPAYLALLSIIGVLLIVAIIGLIAFAVSRKNQP